jgi:hypothetical protein
MMSMSNHSIHDKHSHTQTNTDADTGTDRQTDRQKCKHTHTRTHSSRRKNTVVVHFVVENDKKKDQAEDVSGPSKGRSKLAGIPCPWQSKPRAERHPK